MSKLFWLTDAKMARLQPYFPQYHGKPSVDDRRVPCGIIFISRNGLSWYDAPKEYGPLEDPLQSMEAVERQRCPKVFLSAVALAATVMLWLLR